MQHHGQFYTEGGKRKMPVGFYVGLVIMIVGFVLWGSIFVNKEKANIYNALYGLAAVIIGLIVLIVACCAASYRPYNPEAAASKYKVSCPICGRSYDNTSADAKSISSSNMCTQCKKNYNYATN